MHVESSFALRTYTNPSNSFARVGLKISKIYEVPSFYAQQPFEPIAASSAEMANIKKV